MTPANARRRHPVVEERERKLAKEASAMEINRVELRDRKLGVVCSGACYYYVREAAPDASVFKLGMTYPLPKDRLTAFAGEVDRLVVIEELEPFVEDSLRAMGLMATGKERTGLQGELSVAKVRKALYGDAKGAQQPNAAGTPVGNAMESISSRPPALCAGCPHRATFYEIKTRKLTVFGDIGCYTLAAAPPLSAKDTTLCMGASIGMAFGAEKARGKAFSRSAVAVIGDSTFLHSGVTSLINAVYGGGTITVLILDNRITGMTGHQENPSSGKDIYGNTAPMLDLEALCRGCGAAHVRTVDPYDTRALKEALDEELSREAVSVLIVRKPCVLLEKEHDPPVYIEACRNCGVCLRIGCPAMSQGAAGITIDESLCVGCGLCVSLCPFHCIKEGAKK